MAYRIRITEIRHSKTGDLDHTRSVLLGLVGNLFLVEKGVCARLSTDKVLGTFSPTVEFEDNGDYLILTTKNSIYKMEVLDRDTFRDLVEGFSPLVESKC